MHVLVRIKKLVVWFETWGHDALHAPPLNSWNRAQIKCVV